MVADTRPSTMSGAVRFARYAFPPNDLGYCGPAGGALGPESLVTPDAHAEVRQWAQQFEGAWPYLSLIAETTGIGDPLDNGVVEAYWIGSDLLDEIPLLDFGNSLRDRFRPRQPTGWIPFVDTLASGVVPHHSFHVFCVYPWVGLLRGDRSDIALSVLNQCRIRIGTVVAREKSSAIVETSELRLDRGELRLGPPTTGTFRVFDDSYQPGQLVSLHWDWVCEAIDGHRAAQLRRWEHYHLIRANATLSKPETLG